MVINLCLGYFVVALLWEKGNPIHILWVVPLALAGLLLLGIITGLVVY